MIEELLVGEEISVSKIHHILTAAFGIYDGRIDVRSSLLIIYSSYAVFESEKLNIVPLIFRSLQCDSVKSVSFGDSSQFLVILKC